MSDNTLDPSANTEAFRAFTETPADAAPASRATPLIVAGAVVGVIVLAVLVWLALS